jgi:diacylglycerol kinase (ATP)
MNETEKTFILVNPRARNGEVAGRWPKLEEELLSALKVKSAQVDFTSAEDHGAIKIRNALKSGFRKIVVVGGDGTLSEAVQGFFEEGRAIAPDAVLFVMPGGRGDDFFKTLRGSGFYGARGAWLRGLDLIYKGKPQKTDLGQVEFFGAPEVKRRYFINIASFGFPGLVVSRVLSQQGSIGRSVIGKSAWTYMAQTVLALSKYRPLPITVKVDGQLAYEGPIFSGFILNGAYNGGGMCWSKNIQLDDGFFEVVVLEPRNIAKTLCSASKMLSGKWQGTSQVHVLRGQNVEITQATDVVEQRQHPLFEVDGDLPEPGATYGARLQIVPGAIQIWR